MEDKLKELEKKCGILQQELIELHYKYDELTRMIRKEGKDRAANPDDHDEFLREYGARARWDN